MKIRHDNLIREIERIQAEKGKLFWAESGNYAKEYARLAKRRLSLLEIAPSVEMVVSIDQDRYPEEWARKVREAQEYYDESYIPVANARALEIMDECVRVRPGEGAEELIPVLITFLGNEDPRVQERAREALRSISAGKTFELLCRGTISGNLTERYFSYKYLGVIEMSRDEINRVENSSGKIKKVVDNMLTLYFDRRYDRSQFAYLLMTIQRYAPLFPVEMAPSARVLAEAASQGGDQEAMTPLMSTLAALPANFVEAMPPVDEEQLKKRISDYARTFSPRDAFLQEEILPALQNIAKQKFSHFDRLKMADQTLLKTIEWAQGG